MEYKGIRNPGCLCYMISIIQQLFMLPIIKNTNFLDLKSHNFNDLQSNINEREALVIMEFLSIIESLNNNNKIEDANIDITKFYYALCILKDYPIDLSQQKDASEFLSTILQLIDKIISIKLCVSGKLINYIYLENKRELAHLERLENFYYISLNIRNIPDIYKSLDDFTKTENVPFIWKHLEGSNGR